MDRKPAPELPDWLAPLVPYERYRLSVGEHTLHVMERGEGRPLLMVHGNPTWGFLYRKVVAELPSTAFRIVMPDLVGLGFSDKPRDPAVHRLDDHMSWLATLVERLDLRDVLLVVQDWGGPIGLGAFVDQPERLGGLVVLNTVLGPPRPGFKPSTFHRFASLPLVSTLVFRGLGFPQRGLHLAQGNRDSIRGVTARAYLYPLRRIADRVAPLALARMVPDSLKHPSIPALERVQGLATSLDCPRAIVWGKRDPVLGRALGRIKTLLPAARVTETGAGHFLQEEVPVEIADAIRWCDAAG